MPDWGKMNFVKYPEKSWDEILPDTNAPARNLIERLVVYQSTDREPASKVCRSDTSYLTSAECNRSYSMHT